MSADRAVEDLLRELAPQVLGVLARRYGQFDACEDAVQDALLEAATAWTVPPGNPRGWLLTVATRRLTDGWRSESARRRREVTAARQEPDPAEAPAADDTLTLLLLCCHPALSAPSQLALTLRAVGGLTTAEIAAAFLVPEPTMAQRISRAKKAIRGDRFVLPPPDVLPDRLRVVEQVLYLVFNEGYAASSGPDLQRAELTAEAIRLTRLLRDQLPKDPEIAGLLALMLLTDSRRAARTDADGRLVPLSEQDRECWDRALIAEGVALVEQTLATTRRLGPYQLQAAIAATHAEAARDEDTDWPQVVALYRLLAEVAPNPMVTLNSAVAVAMVDGPEAGLALLDDLPELAGHHRLAAVRAHLLERAGSDAEAGAAYRLAARRTTSLPERRYLESRAARLG
ncbi:MAG TPA: sigma-70 family RNA polymerase sigma factor [Mycobacteriales bacterium]|nr:sigma-70 family RNA polymerase sigma factor [Mycobacteriales bacterium]